MCDPMEKIWIKNELYILSYEFLKFMSFFYLIFKLIFIKFSYLKNRKGGFTYPQVLMWRDGPASELTWHAGPPRGCDAALRPRGRAAGGPREAQVAHRARTCGRRPRVSTRVHADARVGCHMAGGWHMEGPRVSGPW